MSRLSFGFFSLAKQRKEARQEAKQDFKVKAGSPLREDDDSLLNEVDLKIIGLKILCYVLKTCLPK